MCKLQIVSILLPKLGQVLQRPWPLAPSPSTSLVELFKLYLLELHLEGLCLTLSRSKETKLQRKQNSNLLAMTSYWCHRCRSRVTPLPSSSPLPLCPVCREGFLEEMGRFPSSLPSALLLAGSLPGDDGPGSRLHDQYPGFPDLLPRRSPSRIHDDGRPPLILQLLEVMSILASPSGARRDLDRSLHLVESRRDGESLHNFASPDRLHGLLSRRGDPDDDGEGLGSIRVLDVRDIFMGSGLDAFIQRLGEGDGGRYGSAPASKAGVEAMPVLKFAKDSAEGDDIHCAVCKEAFEMGGEVRQMPCEHIYHSDCILPWLALHSTCPICRREMPAETSTDRQPRSNEGSMPEDPLRGTRPEGGEAGGGRGLAILGIPGVGIRVRSFTLWGNDNRQTDQGPNNEAQELDLISQLGSRASSSSGTSPGEEGTRSDLEMFELASGRPPHRRLRLSREHPTRTSGSRRLLSWFRNSGSSNSSTSGGDGHPSSSEGTNNDHSTRRHWW